MYEKGFKMMELYIETLTGTAFELRVSPFETVQDVKHRIQNLEGIPVTQQHLIWQSLELEDDCSLQDYSIHDGATLKLVLTMRGGPINTRRIPVDDPTLRDMAEYYLSEANRDDIIEKLPPGNRPMTVIVYHNGDQLNFYRVVDPESSSPLSESVSGASMYNLCDDEDEVDDEETEESEENDKTRAKMKLLKIKMENLSLNKKQHPKRKFMPRPPSTGRPKSLLRHSGKHSILHRHSALPPVATFSVKQTDKKDTGVCSDCEDQSSGKDTKEQLQSGVNNMTARSKLMSSLRQDLARSRDLGSVDKPGASGGSSSKPGANMSERIESLLRRAQQATTSATRKLEFSRELLLKSDGEGTSVGDGGKSGVAGDKEGEGECVESKEKSAGKDGERGALERVLEDNSTSSLARSSATRSKDLSLEAFRESLVTHHRPPARTASVSGKKSERKSPAGSGVILECLDPSEVRAMSGMLSSIVRSASKTHNPSYMVNSGSLRAHIPSPDGRHMSAKLQRLSSSRDGRVLSPRLPPVKQKKKSKRCFVCAKKTGLATSYKCRCGNNFCATHRYAEAHDCTFDYKNEGRKILEQNNPVVTAPKLPKI